MARKLFERQGIRTRGGALATGVVFVAYTDEAATALADISATSGGSSIAGSTFTVAAVAGLGPASFRIWGPTDDTAVLYLRCPADPGLGVQEIEAEPAAGGGVTDHGALTGLADDDHPQYATDTDLSTHAAAANPHSVYALDTDLSTHEGDTTSIHGITDTSALATASGVTSAVSTHAGLSDPHTGYVLESAHTLAGHDALTRGSFPQSMDGRAFLTAGATGSANRGWYLLGTEGVAQNINRLHIYIGTSSGNISGAVYASTGAGRARAPAARLATSGAVACGTGALEQTLTLDGTVAYVPFETWFFLSADNATATFARISGLAPPMAGLSYLEASAHPAPTNAGTLTAGSIAYWIAGSLV